MKTTEINSAPTGAFPSRSGAFHAIPVSDIYTTKYIPMSVDFRVRNCINPASWLCPAALARFTKFLTHKYAQLIAYYAFLRTQIEANQRGVADQVKFHCHVAGIHVARRHQTHKQRDINSI